MTQGTRYKGIHCGSAPSALSSVLCRALSYDVPARTSSPAESALYISTKPGNCAAFWVCTTYYVQTSRLQAPCMLGSVLPMATLSSRLVVVAIVASALGFPRMAWSATPLPSTAFLSILLSQRTTRGCHKQALPMTSLRSCSVSEATDRQTRTSIVTGRRGRRTRDAVVASDDRGATGADELVLWDEQIVTYADELVWPNSDSPAHAQELPVPGAEVHLVVDADATAAATAAAVAAVAAMAVSIFLAPLDAAAATTTTMNIQLAAQASAAPLDIGAILAKAGKASFGGGASGAAAAVVQVLSLMWLRTTMNFQVSLPRGTTFIGVLHHMSAPGAPLSHRSAQGIPDKSLVFWAPSSETTSTCLSVFLCATGVYCICPASIPWVCFGSLNDWTTTALCSAREHPSGRAAAQTSKGPRVGDTSAVIDCRKRLFSAGIYPKRTYT